MHRSPQTVNNVLTTLSVVLRTAVEWGVIERVPCSIRLLRAPKGAASFYGFHEHDRLVGKKREASRRRTWPFSLVATPVYDAARSWPRRRKVEQTRAQPA
jgi:hypothetical protein